MTKADLTKAFAKEFNVTQSEAEKMVGYSLDSFAQAAVEQGKCSFGKHKMLRKDKSARKGRNPQTGEEITIPAKSVLQYKQLNS